MAELPVGDKAAALNHFLKANGTTVETREASPADLLIKIESFSLLSKHGIRKYESDEFVSGDYKWRLMIQLDGNESQNDDDHISLYLFMVGASSRPLGFEVYVNFNIFLFNQLLDKYLCVGGKAQRFHAMNYKRGFYKLISKKNFTDPSSGYLVEDKCVFGAEVFVIKNHPIIECVSLLKSTTPSKNNWRISQFSKLVDRWTSDEFDVGGYKWRALLYPNGKNAKDKSISIFVECVDSKSFGPHKKVEAHVVISIKSSLQIARRTLNYSHWFRSSAPSCGFGDFMSIADINGWLFNDCCVLETEISVQAVVADADKSE